jgi:hypothetical protein
MMILILEILKKNKDIFNETNFSYFINLNQRIDFEILHIEKRKQLIYNMTV